jgi:hypothetical protein
MESILIKHHQIIGYNHIFPIFYSFLYKIKNLVDKFIVSLKILIFTRFHLIIKNFSKVFEYALKHYLNPSQNFFQYLLIKKPDKSFNLRLSFKPK